jgi:hypothetical protein
MIQTTYHLLCFGTLDEEEGTTYSMPFTYDDRDTADFQYRKHERKGKHEAVFLVAETGEVFTILRCSGGDRAHLVKDAPGAFSLLASSVLA